MMKQSKKIVALLLAMSLMLGLSFAVSAADVKTVKVSARVDAPSITIDGNFSKAEWGDPIGSYTAANCTALAGTGSGSASDWIRGWNALSRINNSGTGATATPAADQHVEVYVRRDAANVYVAVRLINASGEDTSITSINKAHNGAHLSFTIGEYNASTAIAHDADDNEKFIMYKMAMVNGVKTNKAYAAPTAPVPSDLADENFAISYADYTYTYEVRIPCDSTNGYVPADKELTMTFDITDAKGGANNGNGTYHYMLGTAAYMYTSYNFDTTVASGAYNVRHSVCNPLRVTFDPSICYEKTQAAPMPATTPNLNGEVVAGEYGDPIIVTGKDFAYNHSPRWIWGGDIANADQRANVYLTNDREYIYLAVTLDNEELTKYWNCSGLDYLCPRLSFMVAATNADGTAIAQTAEGNDDFSAWRLYFTEDGTPTIGTTALVDSSKLLTADDYAANYDENTKTYHYEVRIPYSKTNIDPTEATAITAAVHISASQTNDEVTSSTKHVRYNIGGTALPNLSKSTPNAFTDTPALFLNLNKIEKAEEDVLVEDLLAADNTVVLEKNMDLGDRDVTVFGTLDLAGCTLTTTGTVAVVGGEIIDSTNGGGCLVRAKYDGTKDTPQMLLEGNSSLALYDADRGGYRFFTCSTTQLQAKRTDSNLLGIHIDTAADAYNLMVDDVNADVKLTLYLSVSVDGVAKTEEPLPFTFTRDLLKTYAEGDVTNKNWAIILEIFGFDAALGEGNSLEITTTPKLETNCGLALAPTDGTAVKTYTYSAQ